MTSNDTTLELSKLGCFTGQKESTAEFCMIAEEMTYKGHELLEKLMGKIFFLLWKCLLPQHFRSVRSVYVTRHAL